MLKKKTILIVGSNFARSKHLPVIKKIFDKKNIFVCGSKSYKIKKNYFINFNKAIKKNKYDFISCATTPEKQNIIINKIIKKKILPRGILLEKPIIYNKNFISFIKYIKKNNIKFNVNFTFSALDIFSKIKKILRKKKIVKIIYTININMNSKNNSWKNDKSRYGGMINYYIIHFLFIITEILGKLNFLSIKREGKKILIKLKSSKTIIVFHILNKKNKNHCAKIFINKNHFFSVVNSSEDWFGKFNLYNIKKECIASNTEKIESLIKKNYMFIFNRQNNLKKNRLLSNLVYTLQTCQKINKLYKHDY
jgi:hypothetical protein